MAALHCRCPIARDYTLRRSYLPNICRLSAIAHISLRAMASPSRQPGGAGGIQLLASYLHRTEQRRRAEPRAPSSAYEPRAEHTPRKHAEFSFYFILSFLKRWATPDAILNICHPKDAPRVKRVSTTLPLSLASSLGTASIPQWTMGWSWMIDALKASNSSQESGWKSHLNEHCTKDG